MNNYIALAHKIAARSTHPHHHMAAVVIKGGSILSTAHNTSRWGGCCERRALRPHLDLEDAIIIVVRRNGGMSKPCKHCQQAILLAGIKKVVYVGRDGEIVVDRVSQLN